jgi:endoglucanase
LTEVALTNRGSEVMDGWHLDFSFAGAQRLTQAWNATVALSGATVTATNLSWNRLIRPGQTVSLWFLADTSGANPAPERFRVDGAVCQP